MPYQAVFPEEIATPAARAYVQAGCVVRVRYRDNGDEESSPVYICILAQVGPFDYVLIAVDTWNRIGNDPVTLAMDTQLAHNHATKNSAFTKYPNARVLTRAGMDALLDPAVYEWELIAVSIAEYVDYMRSGRSE